MPVENGAGYLNRRTQEIVSAAVSGDVEALREALGVEPAEAEDSDA